MALDLHMFAEKLRRYRGQFEMSVEEVANATGLLPDTLLALEAETRAPTGDEVLILADYFKCDYKFFVSNERLAPLEQTDKLFRKHGSELTSADRWAIQEFLYLCECEAFLRNALGYATTNPFAFTKRGKFYKAHGEAAAAALRRHLNYSSRAIPVDVYEDFRKIGIHVFRRHLDNSNISGLYLKHPTAGKCVLINYAEDVFRQRFTAAHEVGHAILDEEKDFVVSVERWQESDLVEVRANVFAAHFLLPSEYIRQMPPTSWDEAAVLDHAKRHYVNVDTFLYALEREKRLSEKRVAELKHVKVSQHDKVDPELTSTASTARSRKESLLQRGLSDYYVKLCFAAYAQDLVSASRVAEMMLTDQAGLAEIGDLFGWSQQHDA
jgi:Zn-dependent peptidase ImmA (M78 family)